MSCSSRRVDRLCRRHFAADQHVKEHLGGIFAGGLPDCLPVGGGLVGGVGLVSLPLFAAGLEIARALSSVYRSRMATTGRSTPGRSRMIFSSTRAGVIVGAGVRRRNRAARETTVSLPSAIARGAPDSSSGAKNTPSCKAGLVGFGRAVLYGVQGHIPPGTHFFPPVGFGGLVDAGSDAGGNAGGHDFAFDVAAAVLFAAAAEHIKLGDGETVDDALAFPS